MLDIFYDRISYLHQEDCKCRSRMPNITLRGYIYSVLSLFPVKRSSQRFPLNGGASTMCQQSTTICNYLLFAVDLGFYSQGVPLRAEIIPIACRRSEEHTSELQSLMRNSYAVFCLKKKNNINNKTSTLKSNKS